MISKTLASVDVRLGFLIWQEFQKCTHFWLASESTMRRGSTLSGRKLDSIENHMPRRSRRLECSSRSRAPADYIRLRICRSNDASMCGLGGEHQRIAGSQIKICQTIIMLRPTTGAQVQPNNSKRMRIAVASWQKFQRDTTCQL